MVVCKKVAHLYPTEVSLKQSSSYNFGPAYYGAIVQPFYISKFLLYFILLQPINNNDHCRLPCESWCLCVYQIEKGHLFTNSTERYVVYKLRKTSTRLPALALVMIMIEACL